MSFDLELLPRGEIVAALAPGQAIDLGHDGLVSVRCFWPGCAATRHKSGEDRTPSAIFNPTRGTFVCHVSDARAGGWRELVTACLGAEAWRQYSARCFTDAPGERGPPPLDEAWAALTPERSWSELYRIDADLSARYLRSGRRLPGEVFSDSAVGIFLPEGKLTGIKFRLPAGKVWVKPPKSGHPDDKYLCAKGSSIAGVVFLADRAREGATVVVCAGEKDALVAASHLDPARWAPVSGCVGEGKDGLSKGWAAAITAFCRGRNVVIAYDGDPPGHHGAWRLARALEGAARTVRAARLPLPDEAPPPRGEARWDVAAFVLERQGAALEQLLLAAGPVPATWEPPPPPPGVDRGPARPTPPGAAHGGEVRSAGAPPPPGGPAPSAAGAGAPPPGGRPEIVCCTAIRAMVDQAEAALGGAELGVYHRGGELVRVVRPADRARIVPLPEPTLLELLSACARWTSIDKKGEASAAYPPRDVVRALAARAEWRALPRLEAVVHGPLLRPDGTVLDRPGYDAAARLLYEPSPGVTWPSVPAEPTRAQARAALDQLVDVVAEFPFVAPSDRSAWLALVLTIVARMAVDGPVPLFLVRAVSPGTGKSLLIDVATLIGTDLAGEAPRMAQARDRDGAEEAKRLLALGLEGEPLAMIDNIEEPLGSDVLAMALTARRFKGRALGRNTMVEVQLPVFVATGNNVLVKGDLARRVVPVDLDARVEHPEQRTGFRYPNLVAHVRAHRAELRAAALTVLRWYCAEGRPTAPTTAFGSYEAWAALVPQALIWLGEADPCGGRARIEESGDPEGEARRLALTLWWDKWGPQERTALDVASEAGEELRAALAGLGGGAADKLDVRKLGYALRRIAGRICAGLRLESVRLRGVARWRVVRVGEPLGPAPGGGAAPPAGAAGALAGGGAAAEARPAEVAPHLGGQDLAAGGAREDPFGEGAEGGAGGVLFGAADAAGDDAWEPGRE